MTHHSAFVPQLTSVNGKRKLSKHNTAQAMLFHNDVPSPVEFMPSELLSLGTGSINWENPSEAVAGGFTLLYFAFSIAAGLKYVIKDKWRPKS